MLKDIKMILFLLLLSTISILILAFANIFYLQTKNREIYDIYKLVLDRYEVNYNSTNIEDIFNVNFKSINVNNREYYISDIDNAVVIITEGPGLWSIIKLLLIVSPNREKIVFLAVLSQAETPGLGSRITEDLFLNQFDNVDIRPELKVVKNAENSNEVDGISGATGTSNGVEDIINSAIKFMDIDLSEVEYVP